MFELTKFELKKMLTRRVSLFTSLGIIALLCGIMALNVVQTRAYEGDVRHDGLEAIAYTKAEANEHAGIMTPEHIEADVDAYVEGIFARIDRESVLGVSDAAAYSLLTGAYSAQELEPFMNDYYSYLMNPWRIQGEEPYQTAAALEDGQAAGFYEAVAAKFRASIENGMNGAVEYSAAEEAYWLAKQEAVAEPYAYGYAGGWEDILNCVAFLAFAMIAVCVVLTPTFASEYQEKTDSVLLAARHGRTKLVAAKMLAAFLFTTGYFAVCAAIICGVALAAFGVDGAELPVQTITSSIPYCLTMAQAAGIAVGLAYLMTLGFAALTLALSSKLRSVLAIFAIDVALVFVSGLIPSAGNSLLLHMLYLSPMNALNTSPLFVSCVSYAAGPVVFDLQTMLAVVYALLAAACVPFAVRAFRHHQVV